jgi:hypothetical protein
MWPMENQNVSLLYRNRIYGLGMLPMLSGYIQEYLGMEISLFGCFWQPFQDYFISLDFFQPILEKIRTRKQTSFF